MIIHSFLDPPNPVVDKQLTIGCNIRGTPLPDATWTKNNVTLNETEGIQITVGGDLVVSTLIFDKTTEEDSGLYACIAKNAAGSVNRAFQIDLGQVFWLFGGNACPQGILGVV